MIADNMLGEKGC